MNLPCFNLEHRTKLNGIIERKKFFHIETFIYAIDDITIHLVYLLCSFMEVLKSCLGSCNVIKIVEMCRISRVE